MISNHLKCRVLQNIMYASFWECKSKVQAADDIFLFLFLYLLVFLDHESCFPLYIVFLFRRSQRGGLSIKKQFSPPGFQVFALTRQQATLSETTVFLHLIIIRKLILREKPMQYTQTYHLLEQSIYWVFLHYH